MHSQQNVKNGDYVNSAPNIATVQNITISGHL